MKYISLDIETTSLEKETNNILMISMVLEDTLNIKPLNELPHFTCLIKRKQYKGQPFALGLNGWIFDIISGRSPNKKNYLILDENEWVPCALQFINNHFDKRNATIAGKNVASFDLQFLPNELQSRIHHRCIDPGSTFIDWNKSEIMNLSDIKKSLGLSEIVTHDAYEDALDVINILRKSYNEIKF